MEHLSFMFFDGRYVSADSINGGLLCFFQVFPIRDTPGERWNDHGKTTLGFWPKHNIELELLRFSHNLNGSKLAVFRQIKF